MNLSAKRVLVTGGAGFIGSELVRQLAKSEAKVVVVDNLVNGSWQNLATIPSTALRLVAADVRDAARMHELLKDMDIVFHLACLGVRHSIHSPRENHEVNATGTLNMLLAAVKAKVERFIYVSSSEVYGTAQWAPMSEQHPTFPRTMYGSSKLAAECFTRAFHNTYGFPAVVVRPFNAYGPRCHHEGDSGEVIPKFLLRCMAAMPMVIFGDGMQTRDFTYVSDTAHGIIAVGMADAAVGKTVNIGSGSEHTVNELARQIGTLLGRSEPAVVHLEPRPGDVLRLRADTSLARHLCGYEATVPLQEGLARLKEWYDHQETPPAVLLDQEMVRNWETKRA